MADDKNIAVEPQEAPEETLENLNHNKGEDE